jgi:chromosome segregation ATPase
MQELAEVTSERDSLTSEKFSLQHQVEKAEHSNQELRGMLDKASSELAVHTRQRQTLQGDLRSATRRADEAEKIQKDLQLEGTNLMRSLDEMRPKIVELTSEKLNLTEKAESLQLALRERENTINELTSSLNDARSEIDKTNNHWQQRLSQHEKEHAQTVAASSEMQSAHVELQDQLDDALQSLRNLESQRASQRQELVRNSSEVEKLNATITSRKDELSAVKKELEDQRISEVCRFVSSTGVSMTSTFAEPAA